MIAPVAIVPVAGDLAVWDVKKIDAVVDSLLYQRRAKIIIECGALDSIDLLAIAAIWKIADRVHQADGQVRFAKSNEFVRAAFDRYTDGGLEHYGSIEEAILSFDYDWSGDEIEH